MPQGKVRDRTFRIVKSYEEDDVSLMDQAFVCAFAGQSSGPGNARRPPDYVRGGLLAVQVLWWKYVQEIPEEMVPAGGPCDNIERLASDYYAGRNEVYATFKKLVRDCGERAAGNLRSYLRGERGKL